RALLTSTVERTSWLRTIGLSLRPDLTIWAGNMALGILGAVLWIEAPAALPFLAVPLLLSFFASRAWLRGRDERDRLATLSEAGRSLSGPIDRTTFGSFLGLVRRLLDAQSAELVVVDGDSVTIHDHRGAHLLTAAPEPDGKHQPQAYVPVRDGISPQVAVVGGAGDVRGVLAVYSLRELTASQRALVDVLCSQVGVLLANRRLFHDMEERRARASDIVASTPVGIFTVAEDGSIQSWNPAMETITGSTPERAVGRTPSDVFGWREDLAGAH